MGSWLRSGRASCQCSTVTKGDRISNLFRHIFLLREGQCTQFLRDEECRDESELVTNDSQWEE